MKTRCLVATPGELTQAEAKLSCCAQHSRRLTALLTSAALGEGVSLCVVPPSALEPALGNVVQARLTLRSHSLSVEVKPCDTYRSIRLYLRLYL